MYGIDGGYGKIFVYGSAQPSAVFFIDGSPERAHRYVALNSGDDAEVAAAIESIWAFLPEDYTIATFLTNLDALSGRSLVGTKPFLKLEFANAGQWLEGASPDGRMLTDFGEASRHAPEPSDLATRLAERRRRKRLLLHVCCGPDAAGVIAQLKKDYDLVLFWYDPNIQPKEEHDLRLAAFEKVARLEAVPFFIGEYDVERFYNAIRGLEHTPEQGAKCSNCYDLRLERAAFEAKQQKCELYTTTLAISPHKVQQKLTSFGRLNEKRLGVRYLARNFVKHEGFNDSVEYTRRHDIYRQDYCGCFFSLAEGGTAARWLADQIPAARAPEVERPTQVGPELFEAYQSRLRAVTDSTRARKG